MNRFFVVTSALLVWSMAQPMWAQEQPCGNYTGPIFLDGLGPPDRTFREDPDVVLPPENTALSLSVTHPANNAVFGARSIQVYGTYAGPPATGIAINKVPAVQTAGEFVQTVVLKPGKNTLTIKATKLTGETETITRTVTFNATQAPDIEFTSEISGEHHPIKPRFYVRPKAGLSVTRLQIDFNDDGTDDLDSTSVPGNLRFEYKLPGFYNVRALVTLDDGDPKTAPVTRTVLRKFAVVPLPLTRRTVCYVFYRMKARLAANDVSDAVLSVNPEFRGEIQSEFLSAPSGAAIAQNLGEVRDGRLGIKLSTLVVSFRFRNRTIAGSVVFERSSDAVWRISNM